MGSTNNTREWRAFAAKNDEFRAARTRCAVACAAFNALPEDAPAEAKAAAFLEIAPSCGTQVPGVKPPLFMDYGLRVRVDPTAFINRGCKILDTPVADVTIGARCLIAPDVCIISVSHPLNPSERGGANPSLGKPVAIGDDVWVGTAAQICPGVTIGSGAVVLPSAVVVKDVPENCMVGGVPAKVMKTDLHLLPWAVEDDSVLIKTMKEALRS